MELDRSIAPEFHIPTEFTLSSPTKIELSSGLPLYFFQTPGIEAFKLEVIGKTGRDQLPLHHSLIPSFTLQMILEGTTEFSEEEISEILDFHATEVHPVLSFTHEGLSLLSTRKHFSEVLPLFISLFTQATFPEKNLEKRKSQRKLSLKIEREKSSSRSSQLFRNALFGEKHPYGKEITEEQIDLISPELLRTYYQQYLWQGCEIFISGNFNEKEFLTLSSWLEKIPSKPILEETQKWPIETKKIIYEERKDSVQSSIRLGSWSIPKSHPDFHALALMNTILGGYFGSRLVKNIREDKGHTYGISSSLVEIGNHHYWVIGADVQKSFSEEVKGEIRKEITRLTTEKIGKEELEIVRNYIVGQMLSKFSSSFDLMDRFRSVHYSGLDFSFFLQKMEFLKNPDSDYLMVIAKDYFLVADLVEVTVG